MKLLIVSNSLQYNPNLSIEGRKSEEILLEIVSGGNDLQYYLFNPPSLSMADSEDAKEVVKLASPNALAKA